GVALLSIGIVAIVASLTTGLRDRRALLTFAIAAAAPVALYMPFQYLFFYGNSWWVIVVVAIILAAIGAVAGVLLGGDRKAYMARVVGLAAAITTLPLVLDQMFQRWAAYERLIPLSTGVISTIGS